MAITELIYTLDSRKKVNWSAVQEKSISTDYPFELHAEPLDQYVARTYLQFLWLPESIMPLRLLVPSLQRVNAPSISDASIHPMHAFLAPLLLTTRSSANKYHIELPQILSDGGGAGEMEETMMWYALTHEKADDETQSCLPESADGPWVFPKWRQKYFERMERREVQIQILLYFLKLSLAGSLPPPPDSSKKRKRSREPPAPSTTIEDELEAFMDKLSMWQLIGSLDVAGIPGMKTSSPNRISKEELESRFKTQLPEACALLRSKVFPSSLFSDHSSNASTSRNVSPEPELKPLKESLSRTREPSVSRLPSPTLSTSSRTTTKSKTDARALVRSRSRSLSMSLAQEKERERAASAAPPKKRVLNREISMSRVFKPKLKPKDKATTSERGPKPETAAPVNKKVKDLGVTLVEETPVKPRLTSTKTLSFGQASLGIAPIKDLKGNPKNHEQNGTFLSGSQLGILDEDDEEEFMMTSSPDILLLNPKQGIGSSFGADSDEEVEEAQATPSKPSRKRK
ncbi:hypothetical protein BYT27DRAFT_7075504 [Phlegmacium glaucopus]|nr:hypothetical protein BYT27DRAFT_7075504 [Phlegmacium glaucopus]